MEFLEVIAIVVIAFMALTVYQKIEGKKADVQRQIAQAEADAAINKARVWAQSQERQAAIDAQACTYGFNDPADADSGQFDINSILQFVGSPEGQQLLQNLLKSKQ